MSCQSSWSGFERVEGAGVFGELLGRQTLLNYQSASIETNMSTLHTLALSTIISARLLPLTHSFGVVVCFKGGLSSSWLPIDDVAIWIAEDLGTSCDAKDPY